jgi:hypothetical protein
MTNFFVTFWAFLPDAFYIVYQPTVLHIVVMRVMLARNHRQQSGGRTVVGAIFDVWESAKKWLSCVERVWC